MQNFEDLFILNWLFFLCRSVCCHSQLQVSSICHRSFPTSCQVRPSRWPVVGIWPVKMSWKCHEHVMKKMPDISMLMLGLVEWKWMKTGVESLKLLGNSWQYDMYIYVVCPSNLPWIYWSYEMNARRIFRWIFCGFFGVDILGRSSKSGDSRWDSHRFTILPCYLLCPHVPSWNFFLPKKKWVISIVIFCAGPRPNKMDLWYKHDAAISQILSF